MNNTWYEVWADETVEPPYLLLVLSASDGGIFVRDPKEGNKIVYQADSYEEAMYWLTEDEYTRVDGRMALDV